MTSLPCKIYNNIALSGFMAKILSASKCGRSKGNGQRDRFVWKWLQNSETNGAVINELLSGYDSRNIFQLFEFAGEKFLFSMATDMQMEMKVNFGTCLSLFSRVVSWVMSKGETELPRKPLDWSHLSKPQYRIILNDILRYEIHW